MWFDAHRTRLDREVKSDLLVLGSMCGVMQLYYLYTAGLD